ncbi:amidohydrolase family protein (plasmid) [Agrobacterium salinitolerans]|uniref:metal-dependent hydrolase family protein n=1 Tax=Agrobacterium salinitolerans TaxID=1183413 RepID=UPI001C2325EB|nr:amidohydrolase family protein [Agrobacterium salinitolerans]QXC52884.1 amidohydrolase family protein [Agrobacterium salinitolerans]
MLICGCCVSSSNNVYQGINPCRCAAPETLAAYRRIHADLSRREILGGITAVLGMFAGFGLSSTPAKSQTPPRPVLLTNLRLFDGENLKIREDVDILIDGGRIFALPAKGQGPTDAERIDCGGRTVIPGLIDAHWHSTLAAVTQTTAMTGDIGYVHMVAAKEAGATLMRGFTTVRDMGGPAFALKRAVDEGLIPGPRIFPSGAMISQTSGHGDFRTLTELPRTNGELSYPEKVGVAAIADGADLVLMRTREQLMHGASQIKIMAGGGVASPYDPLEVTQYTERELRAAVEAAEDWGTYVCSHAYTSAAVQRAIRAGIKSIEHGQLVDEDTVKMMGDAGVWWSLQPFLMDEDANQYPDAERQAAQKQVSEGTVKAFEWAKEYKIPTAFGTDILMTPAGTASQGRQLAKLARFMSPLEALHIGTGANGKLLAMSGGRSPYSGKLGIIEPGAFADLLVVEGDPEKDLSFLSAPDENFHLIMKGGQIFKNTL